jgi:hypothetical protein
MFSFVFNLLGEGFDNKNFQQEKENEHNLTEHLHTPVFV